MVYEGLKTKGSMVIVPSTAVETMGLGAMGGSTAFGRVLGPKSREPDAEAGDDEVRTAEPLIAALVILLVALLVMVAT